MSHPIRHERADLRGDGWARSVLGRAGVAVALVAASMTAATSGAVAAPVPSASTFAASGRLSSFGPGGGTVAGFTVYVLERPELSTETDAAGRWRIDGIAPGSAATFAMDGNETRYPIHTATFADVDRDLDAVTIQSPARQLIGVFEAMLGVTSDPARCHIASTVTRQGYSLGHGAPDGTHGEPGATVTISPEPAHGGTPIYFNGSSFDVIWPDRALSETTADGGVVFVNVTPGTYTLTAHKQGAAIRSVTVECIAGRLVNASPPWGLQVLSGGLGPDETVPFPTSVVPTTTGPVTAPVTSRPVLTLPTTTAVLVDAMKPPADVSPAVPLRADPARLGYTG